MLDRTSVPNGAAISGTLETVSGLRGSLLLIDNKGMAFNLDSRVTVQSGKAVFRGFLPAATPVLTSNPTHWPWKPCVATAFPPTGCTAKVGTHLRGQQAHRRR